MLAYFPELYEGELLYSWFARYHVHSSNVSPKQTLNDLFGTTNVTAIADLPTHLNDVHERLVHFNVPELDELIGNHTLFRYYTAFQPENIKYRVLSAMKEGIHSSTAYMVTGMAAGTVREPEFLRFCPSCFKENQEQKGEFYWHVSHQMPGVLTCWKHGDYLCSSTVKYRNPDKHEFIMASNQNCSVLHSQPEYSEKTKGLLHLITEQMQDLLSAPLIFSIENVQHSYQFLLQEAGFVSAVRTINQQKLASQFRKFYSDELLHLLQSSVSYEDPNCWLKSITRKHRKAFHPIRHVLFIHFLGESIHTFYYNSSKSFFVFEEAPYYCLNPAAKHYKQRVIPTVKITRCSKTKRPVGTFTCSCGFIYSRKGPDTTSQDKFKIGRIKQFGPVWKEKLHQLIHIEKKSYYAVAKELKCDIATVKKYANPTSVEIMRTPEKCSEILLKQQEWVDMIKQYPELSVTELRAKAPALYAWHYRNNKKWLQQHSPKKIKQSNPIERVDWAKRDQLILQKVREAVKNLSELKKPVFINRSRIGKEIGQLALLEKSLYKMPATQKYIEENVESREKFRIRRVKWACEHLAATGKMVTEWRVQRLAGLSEPVTDAARNALQSEVRKYKEGDPYHKTTTMAF